MERMRPTIRMAKTLGSLVLALGCCGCHNPVTYHIKHYRAPFDRVAKSNKTYFHSGTSGKIIAKDPCAQYCEPACYGYEHTTWMPWPAECTPPVEQIISDVPTDTSEVSIPRLSPLATDQAMSSALAPVVSGPPDAPGPDSFPLGNDQSSANVSIPSVNVKPIRNAPAPPIELEDNGEPAELPGHPIPNDFESSLPSPSDSGRTKKQQRQNAAQLAKKSSSDPKKVIPVDRLSKAQDSIDVNKPARKVVPTKKKTLSKTTERVMPAKQTVSSRKSKDNQQVGSKKAASVVAKIAKLDLPKKTGEPEEVTSSKKEDLPPIVDLVQFHHGALGIHPGGDGVGCGREGDGGH